MAADPPGKYSANRVFEWVATAGLINTGVILLFWPSTIATGNFRLLLHLVGPNEFTALCISAGMVRAVTLILNGRLALWGPRVRAIMASVSLFILLEMVAALWLRLGQPSLVTGFLIALAGGELRSIARARRDLHGG